MRKAGIFLGLLLAAAIASVFLGGGATAHVSATDAAATHAYLEARLALLHVEAAHRSTEADAVDALAQTVKRECPDVLQHAGPYIAEDKEGNQVATEIAIELSEVIPVAGSHVDRAALDDFYKTVRRLQWSNPGLTKRLHDLARAGAEQSGVSTPPLCADMKFWVASDYTATTAATKHFVQRIKEIPPTNGETIRETVHRLSSYEANADRLLARKVLKKEPLPNSPVWTQWVKALESAYEALGAIPGR